MGCCSSSDAGKSIKNLQQDPSLSSSTPKETESEVKTRSLNNNNKNNNTAEQIQTQHHHDEVEDETSKPVLVLHHDEEDTAEPSPLAVTTNPLAGAPIDEETATTAADDIASENNNHNNNKPTQDDHDGNVDDDKNNKNDIKTPLESEDSDDDDDEDDDKYKDEDYVGIPKIESSNELDGCGGGPEGKSKKVAASSTTAPRLDEDGKPLPSNLAVASYHSLQLRTKFGNYFEAVAIGNQIFVSELNPLPASAAASTSEEQNQNQNNNNNASSALSAISVAINETNRVALRPIGFLGDESLETMKSRSCSALSFSHDSTLICTATREGRISIWSTITGEESQAFGWSASLANFNVSSTRAAAAARRRRSTMKGANSSVTSRRKSEASHSNNNDEQEDDAFLFGLAAGGEDSNSHHGGFLGGNNDISTSDVFKGVELQLCLSTPSTSLFDNTTAIIGGEENNAFYSNNNNNNSTTATTHQPKFSSIHSIAWSHNDRNIFCGLADGSIQIWDVDSCALRADAPVIYNGHTSWVVSLATNNVHLQDFEKRKKFPKSVQLLLASSSIDETICIFDVTALDLRSTQKEITLLRKIENGHTGSINCVIFANDIRIYYGGSDDEINNTSNKLEDHDEGGEEPEEQEPENENTNNNDEMHQDDMFGSSFAKMAAADNEKTTSTTTKNNANKKSTTAKKSSRKFKHYVHIISASADKTIKCWDVRTGKQRGHTISSEESGAHSDSVTSLALSTPDGKSLVSVGQDRTLCRFDVYDFFFQELLFPPEEEPQQQQQHQGDNNNKPFGIAIGNVGDDDSTNDAIMGAYVNEVTGDSSSSNESTPRNNSNNNNPPQASTTMTPNSLRRPSTLVMMLGSLSNITHMQSQYFNSHYASSMMLFSKDGNNNNSSSLHALAPTTSASSYNHRRASTTVTNTANPSSSVATTRTVSWDQRTIAEKETASAAADQNQNKNGSGKFNSPLHHSLSSGGGGGGGGMKVDRLRTGHRDNITGICFIPETNVAVTSSLDEYLKVWNTDNNSNHSTNFGLVGGTTSHNTSGHNLKEDFSPSPVKRDGSTVSTIMHRESSGLNANNTNNNNNNNISRNTSQTHLHASNNLNTSHTSGHTLLGGSSSPPRSFNAASAQSLLSTVTSQKNLKTLLADVQVKSRIYAVAATNDGCVLACGRMDGRTPLYAICKGTPLSRRPLELEERVVSMGFTDDGTELVATDAQGDTTRFLLSTIRM